MKGTSQLISKTLAHGSDGQCLLKTPLTTPSLPVMSSTPPSPEPINITSLVATIADIAMIVQGLTAQHIASASSTNNAPNANVPAQATPSHNVPVPLANFVPPLMSNTPNGVLPTSICSLFPKVKAAIIMAIIMHELRATDLHKLDSKYCHTDTAYAFNGLTNQFEASNIMAKEYKNPNLILILLQTYFAILLAHIGATSIHIHMYFFTYTAHHIKITSEYEWAGVLEYHIEFFNMCQSEMMEGKYKGGVNLTQHS
ncbi:hypothetical protein H0H87_001086 [Tephrocybe sp. NHM501043]|nr:hypothetical protein H0H87_001086 [Tephrocybe sp. NHM501043]